MPLSPENIPLAAAGISGGSGLLGSIIGAASSSFAQERQFNFNKQLAAYQNEVNRENWALENSYNSPAAQMARFKEAGLNPHLIYGQGNPGNAGSIPSASPGSVSYANPFENLDLQNATNMAIQTYYDTKMKELDLKRSENAYEREKVEKYEREDSYHALVTWMEDHLTPGENENDPFYVHKWSEDKPRLRKSHWYALYDQILQQGEIKKAELWKILSTIGKLDAETSLLNHQNEVQQGMDKLLDFDFKNMTFGEGARALLQIIITLLRSNNPINL